MCINVCVSGRRYPESVSVQSAHIAVVVVAGIVERVSGKAIDFFSSVS